MKKHNNSPMKSEQRSKQAKSQGPVQRDTKEVMAAVVRRLTEKLVPKAVSVGAGKERGRGALCPNRDRLTLGGDLGDQWSNYCILGVEGETLAEETVADNAKRFYGILTCIDGGARGHRSANPRCLGA